MKVHPEKGFSVQCCTKKTQKTSKRKYKTKKYIYKIRALSYTLWLYGR